MYEVRQADDQYPNMAFKSILLVHHINRFSLKEPCKFVHSYPHKARPAFFWCPADVGLMMQFFPFRSGLSALMGSINTKFIELCGWRQQKHRINGSHVPFCMILFFGHIVG